MAPHCGRFPKTLNWFHPNCNPFYIRHSPNIAFWTFSPWALRPLLLRVSRMQSRVSIILKSCLVSYFLPGIRSLNSWFSKVVTFCHYLSRFLRHNRAADELQLIWTTATPPPCPMWIPGVLGTRTVRCLQKSFLHFCTANRDVTRGSKRGTILWAPNHFGERGKIIKSAEKSQQYHKSFLHLHYICFWKTPGSNIGAANLLLAPGAI